jgi:leucyl aminopeptidase
MKINVSDTAITEVAVDVLAIPIFDDEDFSAGPLANIDTKLDGALTQMKAWKELSGKTYSSAFIPSAGRIAAVRIMTIGCGKRDDFDATIIRQVASAAARQLSAHPVKTVAFALPGQMGAELEVRGAVEGFIKGTYKFDKYMSAEKGDQDKTEIESLTVITAANATIDQSIRLGQLVGEAFNYARGLVDEPPTRRTPTDLANAAKALGGQYGLEMEVFGPDELEKMGAEALLGVARGSAEPARLIVLRHRGAPGDPRMLAIIGKGITFDSGGLNLKPGNYMENMKSDMSGAAAVLGAMQVIGELKPAVNVLGVIPATENMPGGRATKPGDVLRAMNGKTMEVDNTDAEGRIILADAVAYAQKLGATHIVDLATLTGACVIALGDNIAGLLGAPQGWVDQVWASARATGERLWQLPLPPDYRDLIKSEVADVKNTGGRAGGTITGAMFIQHFIDDGVAWAHLDIAGPAYSDKNRPYQPVGATGVGVALLVDLALGFGGSK